MLLPLRLHRAGSSACPERDDVTAARWALIGLFAINGLTLSAWLARVPAIRDALDLTPGQLGTALLTASIGGLATMSVAPRVVLRLGQRTSIRVFGTSIGLAYVLMGAATAAGSVPLLVAGLFLNGVGLAGNNLTINLGSAGVERRVGRPILPQFHAAFSIGAVTGSLIGAASAARSVPLVVHFAVLAIVAVTWRMLAAPSLLVDHENAPRQATGAVDPGGSATLRDTWREQRALMIGVIVLSAVFAEFAANDWLALAVVDGRGAGEPVAALLLALFLGAMTVVRLIGSGVLSRIGRVNALRFGALTSISGVVVFVVAPTIPLAALGTVLWGAGVALNFPIAVSAASEDPGRAAHRIAVLSVFGSCAPLIEPTSIGFLADRVGVRAGLLAVAVVLVVVAAAAGNVAPQARAPRSKGSDTALEPADALKPANAAEVGSTLKPAGAVAGTGAVATFCEAIPAPCAGVAR